MAYVYYMLNGKNIKYNRSNFLHNIIIFIYVIFFNFKILAPTTSDYVAQPVNIPLGAANSLTGGKLKKGVKRKADPSPINSIESTVYPGPMATPTTPVQPLQSSIRRESGRQIKKPRVPDEGILYSQNTTLPIGGSGSIPVIFFCYLNEDLSIITKIVS